MAETISVAEIHFANGEYFRMNFNEFKIFHLYNIFENALKTESGRLVFYLCCAGFEIGVDSKWRKNLYDEKSSKKNVNVSERLKIGDIVNIKLLHEKQQRSQIMTPYSDSEPSQVYKTDGDLFILSCNSNG